MGLLVLGLLPSSWEAQEGTEGISRAMPVRRIEVSWLESPGPQKSQCPGAEAGRPSAYERLHVSGVEANGLIPLSEG